MYLRNQEKRLKWSLKKNKIFLFLLEWLIYENKVLQTIEKQKASDFSEAFIVVAGTGLEPMFFAHDLRLLQ